MQRISELLWGICVSPSFLMSFHTGISPQTETYFIMMISSNHHKYNSLSLKHISQCSSWMFCGFKQEYNRPPPPSNISFCNLLHEATVHSSHSERRTWAVLRGGEPQCLSRMCGWSSGSLKVTQRESTANTMKTISYEQNVSLLTFIQPGGCKQNKQRKICKHCICV